MSVGVMKDFKLKQRNLHVWVVFFGFFDDTVVDARSGSDSRTGSPEGGAASGQIYS